MKKLLLLVIGLSLLISFISILPKKQTINSQSTDVKDTLSSSQLSYFARIGTGTTVGENIIKVNTAANPSKTTNNLFEGDVICVGATSVLNGCTPLVVSAIGNTGFFEIGSTLLTQATANVGSYIIATRSARHTINFTPQSSGIAYQWQFLIRATTGPELPNDGMPDTGGFDIGSNVGTQTTGAGALLRAQDVTCPFGIGTSATGIGTTVLITNANGTTYAYHTITCTLAAGTGNAVGVGASMIVGGASVTNSTQLINPSPNHAVTSEGNADVYNFFVRHLTAAGVVVDGDTARGQIAVVESVRVSATVDPTISFIIDNSGVTGVGTSVCVGSTLSANAGNVTATQVPFGSLLLQAFNNLAQRVSATTNALGGYAVTVYEDSVLTMVGDSTTIPDTTCNTTCGIGTTGTWDDPTLTPSRFGYTLTAVPGASPATMAFITNTVALSSYKPFGVGSANAATIFSNTSTPTAWERAYVCYRMSITNFQPAGNYENKLIYTATATF